MPKWYSFTRAFTGVNFRPNFDKRSGVMMPGSRKLSKVGEGGEGGSRIKGFFFFFFFLGGGRGWKWGGPDPKYQTLVCAWLLYWRFSKWKKKCIGETHSQVNIPRQSRTFWLPWLYALHHEKIFFAHVKMTQMLISTFISTFITDNTSVSYTPLNPTFIYLTSA